MNTYKVAELIVLHLSAGSDTNGNPRRVFVLTHALDGFLDAVDEGYEGTNAVRVFAEHASPTDESDYGPDQYVRQVGAELRARIATKIDTTPSMYRHFVSKRMTRNVQYAIEV